MKKPKFKRIANIRIEMAKKRQQIDALSILIIILGMIMYSVQTTQSKGFGLLVVIIGFIKLFGDIIKNG